MPDTTPAPAPSFTLTPTRKPATRTNPRITLLYGPPKVGKTTATAALVDMDTLLLELEVGNADYIEAWKEDVANMGILMKWCEVARLERAKGRKIRAVIDTLDQLENFCKDDATTAYKASLIGRHFQGKSVLELPKGAGYFHLRTSFESVMDIIEESFDEVIYIAHLREKLLGEEGKEVRSMDLNLTGHCRLMACSRANAIGRLYRDKESRLIADFRTSELITCGGHCPHLKGKEIVLGTLDPATGQTTFHWDKIYLPSPTMVGTAQ